jgi:hypothetical protein
MEVIMQKTYRFLLTASILLATTFTLSCSDDDSGGYPSCSEMMKAYNACDSKYEAEYRACNENEACEDKVDNKMTECVKDEACGGNDVHECEDYYEENC